MYLLYTSETYPNLVSCAFSTIPIFPLFNSQNFLFTCNNQKAVLYSTSDAIDHTHMIMGGAHTQKYKTFERKMSHKDAHVHVILLISVKSYYHQFISPLTMNQLCTSDRMSQRVCKAAMYMNMNIHIPAGGSAHSITESARAVSPMSSSQYTIFLPFLGCVLRLYAPAAVHLLSGILRPTQRRLRSLVFSKTFLR